MVLTGVVLTGLVLVVGAVLLATAVGGLVLLRRPVRRVATVHPGVTGVLVRLAAGRVELAEDDRSDARLELELPARGRGRPAVTVTDGLLAVDGRRVSARVRARLPRGTGVRVEVRQGDIALWGSAGELELMTGSGAIAARELAGRRVTARAGAGDVTLVFDAVPAEATALTDVGDVCVVLPPGPYAVDAAAGDPSRAEVDQTLISAGDDELRDGGGEDPGGSRVTARSRAGAVRVLAAAPHGPVRL